MRIEDQIVGQFANSFVHHSVNITQYVPKPGTYKLELIFSSPTEYCQKEADAFKAKYGYVVPHLEYPNSWPYWNYIRKPACDFGWDWGPALPSMGIAKPIRLCIQPPNTAVITNIHLTQSADAKTFTFNFVVTVRTHWMKLNEMKCLFQVKVDEGRGSMVNPSWPNHISAVDSNGYQQLEFGRTVLRDQPLYEWNPVGYGAQNMCQAIFTIHGTDTHYNFGLRATELVREPDEEGGESFYFRFATTLIRSLTHQCQRPKRLC